MHWHKKKKAMQTDAGRNTFHQRNTDCWRYLYIAKQRIYNTVKIRRYLQKPRSLLVNAPCTHLEEAWTTVNREKKDMDHATKTVP